MISILDIGLSEAPFLELGHVKRADVTEYELPSCMDIVRICRSLWFRLDGHVRYNTLVEGAAHSLQLAHVQKYSVGHYVLLALFYLIS